MLGLRGSLFGSSFISGEVGESHSTKPAVLFSSSVNCTGSAKPLQRQIQNGNCEAAHFSAAGRWLCCAALKFWSPGTAKGQAASARALSVAGPLFLACWKWQGCRHNDPDNPS